MFLLRIDPGFFAFNLRVSEECAKGMSVPISIPFN